MSLLESLGLPAALRRLFGRKRLENAPKKVEIPGKVVVPGDPNHLHQLQLATWDDQWGPSCEHNDSNMILKMLYRCACGQEVVVTFGSSLQT
jgi:hypothetical protein